jgi:type IV secretory pathway VirB2 component (pilin)
MCDDIVERLRRCPEQFSPYSVRTDAAEEIKRLRAWQKAATQVAYTITGAATAAVIIAVLVIGSWMRGRRG